MLETWTEDPVPINFGFFSIWWSRVNYYFQLNREMNPGLCRYRERCLYPHDILVRYDIQFLQKYLNQSYHFWNTSNWFQSFCTTVVRVLEENTRDMVCDEQGKVYYACFRKSFLSNFFERDSISLTNFLHFNFHKNDSFFLEKFWIKWNTKIVLGSGCRSYGFEYFIWRLVIGQNAETIVIG